MSTGPKTAARDGSRAEARILRGGMRRWLWVMGFAVAVGAVGAEEVQKRVLRHGGQFWTIPEGERGDTWPVDFEVTINYFDPQWHVCWVEANGTPMYLPVAAGAAPALESGQRVRLRGTVVPSRGFEHAKIRVTVLGEEEWRAPRRVRGEEIATPTLTATWVEVEGVVLDQVETDTTHVEYRFVLDGEPVKMWLLVNPGDRLPQLAGQRIRVRGVLDGSFDPAGRWVSSELWVPRSRELTVLGPLAEDPRFQTGLTSIGQLAAQAGREARLEAEVVHESADGQLVIRDDSGQISVRTAQRRMLRVGQRIDVVGLVELADGGPVLRRPLLRPSGTHGESAAGAPLQKLRMAAQVLELSAEEAAREHPVAVRGVVTWSHPAAGFFFLEDASGGVRVALGQAGVTPPTPGTSLQVEGRTRMGAYAPEIGAVRWELDMPVARSRPRRVSLEQVSTGREEAQWVAMEGYLLASRSEGMWTRLDLVGAEGEFSALIGAGVGVEDLVGSVVRISGVCSARADGQGRWTGFRLLVPDRGAIDVELPPQEDPFADARVPVVALQRFNPRELPLHRVQVVGRVTARVAGEKVIVQDADAAVEVWLREAQKVPLGAEVEVAGFLGRQGQRPVVREGVWRMRSNPTEEIAPWRLADAKELVLAADRRLVRVEGVLLSRHERGKEAWMTLEGEGGRIFEAYLPGKAEWATGSRLELTGIYLLERDEAGQPREFVVQLREPRDVTVLATPPWWNARRLGTLLAALLIAAVGSMAWIVALRRRVRRQTEQIRAQVAREAAMHAELERASRLESLGVMAGGIAHDFNNLLTAILGNIGLVMLDPQAVRNCGKLLENARRATRRAGDITHQLLTFAKGGEPIRKPVALPELVREAAEFALHGAKVRAEFDCSEGLPAVLADPAQMSRVIHNLVLNAVQAMPGGGVVRLELRPVDVGLDEIAGLRPGRHVRLEVSDTGAGMTAEDLARVFEPYYSTKLGNSGLGLAVVRSIVQRHDGHIGVESKPGSGTVFRLWLPVTFEEIEDETTESGVSSSGGRRLLLMDDEEFVREAAVEALRRTGYQVEAVADGAAAVRAYAQAKQGGQPFDAVILDLTVPGGMGGEDAAREILRIDPTARLIVSSGYSANPVMARYREHGFCAVVPKPYELANLLRAIEVAVASSASMASES